MSSAALLEVRGLTFSYPGRHVFTGWQGDFGAGLTWVRGSNGSGKSTLLKLLAGALRPLTGTLRVAGVDAAEHPLDYRREVFWCGPGAIAFEHLHPREYCALLRGLYPRLDLAAVDAHVQGFGLAPFLGKRLSELSTGTQRKVWLAAALAANTRVVLLDEPLNALDAASLQHLLAQLATAARSPQQALVVASHEPPGDAAGLATRLELEAAA